MTNRQAAADQYLETVRAQVQMNANDALKVRAITEAIDAISDVLAELGRMRRAVITEMRATKSADQIALEIGVSRARVYKLIESGRFES